MKILCHRGAWNVDAEKNSIEALKKSIVLGYGFESDVRDYRGELVISHDIANENSPTVEQVFNFLSTPPHIEGNVCFAINIKADGLVNALRTLIEKYSIKNYFVFDMSLPQMLSYRAAGLIFLRVKANMKKFYLIKVNFMDLKGYSGCKLKLVEDNEKKYVKKISVNENYNSRLKAQYSKQSKVTLNGFKTCRVYDSGIENGLFYFKMDYIQGKTLSEKMFTLDLCEIPSITEKMLLHATNYEEINFDADFIFQAKIEDLQKKLSARVHLNKIFAMLKNFSWQHVINSNCHGDLTLENIIVSGDNLTPIDFLDSFYDSWMIDAAKILQDADVMWSYRYTSPNSNLIIRLTIMRDLIVKKIAKMFMGDKLLETVYMILLLNLIRIFPYVKDRLTENFLSIKTEYLVEKINYHKWRD